jgi:hypothetical protein
MLQPAEPRSIAMVETTITMSPLSRQSIPSRAQTLDVLRHMGTYRPILMLPGHDDGYGTRWVIDGQQVQPGIAKYLMEAGYVADSGATEFGARRLMLTDSGDRFRANGMRWWQSLGFLERLRIRFLG